MNNIVQNRTKKTISNPLGSSIVITLSGGSLTTIQPISSIITRRDATFIKSLTSGTYRNPYTITSTFPIQEIRDNSYVLSSNNSILTYNTNANTVTTQGTLNGCVVATSQNFSNPVTLVVKSGHAVKYVSVDVSQQTPLETDYFVSAVSGSLASVLISSIDTMITGKNPAATMPLFVSPTVLGTTYVRNSAIWCQGVDLSFMSPWNSAGGNNYAGNLITPRHIIMATHYHPGVGTTIDFVDMNNVVQRRTISGEYDMLNGVDITICTLNADLTGGVKPIKIMPNIYPYVPNNTLSGSGQLYEYTIIRPPMIGFNQDLNAIVGDNAQIGEYETPSTFNSLRAPFYVVARGGDSGHPVCFLIGKTCYYGFHQHYAAGNNGVNGTYAAGYENDINSVGIPSADASAGLASGYANSSLWATASGRYIVQTLNLSAYPSFN